MVPTRTLTAVLVAAGVAFAQSVSQQTDGQPTVASATATAVVSQQSDGQITAGTATASASVGQQSDGQVTVATSHVSSSAAPVSVSSKPVSGTETALFSSLAITEASHTETIQVPVNTETGPLTFSSMAITEAGTTETIPVPVPVSKYSSAGSPSMVITPVAPTYTYTGPYVPSSGFTSTVITEANHTETVPIPIVSYATSGGSFSMLAITEASHTETIPVPVGPATASLTASKSVASGSAAGGSSNGTATYSTPAPAAYTGAATALKPVAALLGAAMFLRALI